MDEAQRVVLQRHRPYVREIETAAMTRSYKMVLLEAMLELDGFIHAQTTRDLAIRSGEILLRRPPLMTKDLGRIPVFRAEIFQRLHLNSTAPKGRDIRAQDNALGIVVILLDVDGQFRGVVHDYRVPVWP